jgi:hypothetical protein
VGSINAAVVFNTIISANHSLDTSCTFLGVTLSPTVYWMHVGALVPAMGQVNLTLTNGQMTLVKTIAANTTLDDTVTMTGVVDFASGAPPTQLSIISSQPTFTVNWAGFRIDTYNNPFVAFRVACSTSQDYWENVNFDLVQLNVGGGWITSSSAFTVHCTCHWYICPGADNRHSGAL